MKGKKFFFFLGMIAGLVLAIGTDPYLVATLATGFALYAFSRRPVRAPAARPSMPPSIAPPKDVWVPLPPRPDEFVAPAPAFVPSATRLPSGRVVVVPASPPVQPPAIPPAPPAKVAPPSRPPEEPSRAALGWRRLRDQITSDVAVNGLAYLGVLLLFTGTFGFVVFSFERVRIGLRPLAELLIAAAFFGSAWFLRRRRAVIVAAALELVGGILLPVVLAASLVDGAAFPPELHGGALIGALVVGAALVAGLYAAWSARRPESALRFLVAPMVWTACWAIGLLFAGDFEAISLRSPMAAQMALVTVGVAATLVPARLVPEHRLSEPALTAAIPGTAIAYAMTLLLAVSEGFPFLPVAAAGASVLAISELVGDRRLGGRLGVATGQWIVLAVTASAAVEPLGGGAAGALLVPASLALLEWQERVRPSPVARPAAALGVGFGIALAFAEPWWAVGAGGVASSWAHVRRIRGLPAGGGEEWLDAATAALPVSVGAGLLLALPAERAWLVIAVLICAGTLAVRLTRRRDELLEVWLPLASVAVAAGTLTVRPISEPVPLAAAATLAALSIAIGPRWPAARVWPAFASGAWALTLWLDVARISPEVRPLGWAALGLAAVGFAPVWRERAAGHLALAGHLATLSALAAPGLGRARLWALAAWTVGWVSTVAWGELGRPALTELLGRAAETVGVPRLRRLGAILPGIALVTSAPFLIVHTLERTDLLAAHRSWTGVALALTAVAYAGAARALALRKPLAPVLAAGSFAVSSVGIAVAAPDPWPVIEAVVAPIVGVLLVGGALRRAFMEWIAWAASGLLVMLLAGRAGVETRAIPVVLMGWGTVLMAGGLLLDDRSAGRRSPGEGVRSPWLARPVLLGAVGLPVGLAFIFTGTPSQFGTWSLAAAGAYLAVAFLLRAGAVSAPAWALLSVGLAALSPWSPMERPWLLVPWTLVLVSVSLATQLIDRSRGVRRDAWIRWDVAPLAVAHGVAAVALFRSTDVGWMPQTWVGLGAVSLALAGVRPSAVWARVTWALAGIGLTLVGAGAAGPGWLSLALAVTAAGFIVAASRSRGDVRSLLQADSVMAAAASWLMLSVWAGWNADRAAMLTALAAGAAALALGTGARFARLGRDWVAAFGTLAAAGLATAGTIAAESASALTWDGRRPVGLALATGAAMAAVGSAISAEPLRVPRLREVGALLALAAGGTLGYAIRADPGTFVAGFAAAGIAAVLGSLALWRVRAGSPWLNPLALIGAISSLFAFAAAATTWPRRDLVVAALLVAGTEAAAVGITLRHAGILALCPPLLCSAWLVYASEALTGDPQWFTVPIGVALLAVVEIGLRNRPAEPEEPTVGTRAAADEAFPLVPIDELLPMLDLLGMALVVGASLVEIVAISPGRGIVAVLLAAVIGAFGILTRTKRRVFFSMGSVLAAVFLMIGVPLARLVRFQGTALWVALAAAGAILVVIATTLEQARARVNAVVHKLSGLMEGWA